MPYTKKTKKTKRSYKPRGKRMFRRRRFGQNGLAEWSSGSFTRPLLNPSTQQPVFQPNTTYRLYDLAIDQFPRAVLLARAHQMYRIKKVTIRFKPLIDTFAVGGGATVPNLYYMIDTQQALSPNVGLASLKAMGATPRRLDDKVITARYTPGVLDNVNDTAAGGGAFAKRILAPWLNTTDNPFAVPVTVSNVDHKGITWCVEEVLGTSANYTVDVIIDVQFKKAAIEPSTGGALGVDVQ